MANNSSNCHVWRRLPGSIHCEAGATSFAITLLANNCRTNIENIHISCVYLCFEVSVCQLMVYDRTSSGKGVRLHGSTLSWVRPMKCVCWWWPMQLVCRCCSKMICLSAFVICLSWWCAGPEAYMGNWCADAA